MATRVERLAALRQRLTTAEDVEFLLELEQIHSRLEAAGRDFTVTTLVSHRTGHGLLDVVWLGQLAQLTPAQARETAWILIEAAVAESEAAVLRFLRERVELSADQAARMVQDFRRFRNEDPGSLVGAESH